MKPRPFLNRSQSRKEDFTDHCVIYSARGKIVTGAPRRVQRQCSLPVETFLRLGHWPQNLRLQPSRRRVLIKERMLARSLGFMSASGQKLKWRCSRAMSASCQKQTFRNSCDRPRSTRSGIVRGRSARNAIGLKSRRGIRRTTRTENGRPSCTARYLGATKRKVGATLRSLMKPITLPAGLNTITPSRSSDLPLSWNILRPPMSVAPAAARHCHGAHIVFRPRLLKISGTCSSRRRARYGRSRAS